jgi:cyclic pyranopterin phosphate synthase
MPEETYGERYEFLPKPEILRFEEIERLSRIFRDLGVTKIRITGGEPLIRAELTKLIGKLASIERLEDLALTTNGYTLASQARALRDAGLRRVTISLDSLDDEVFKRMNGRGCSVDRVLEGIEVAQRVGLHPIKLNCVVQRGVNDHTIVDLAKRFKGTGHIVRFIEFMDVGTLNGWELSQVVSAGEILARIHAEMPLEPAALNYRGEVARRYVYADGDGEIGIIASVSQPFCSDCSRARLTPDGHLVTCLFAIRGEDLKTPLRAGASDAELQELIRRVWSSRTDRYSEERSASTCFPSEPKDRTRIEMYQLGG